MSFMGYRHARPNEFKIYNAWIWCILFPAARYVQIISTETVFRVYGSVPWSTLNNGAPWATMRNWKICAHNHRTSMRPGTMHPWLYILRQLFGHVWALGSSYLTAPLYSTRTSQSLAASGVGWDRVRGVRHPYKRTYHIQPSMCT